MTTRTASSDCQVLVVGSGPTGLTLAAQLLARGVSTRVIDKGDGPSPQSRALAVHARTLELLDTMGLAEELLARGHEVAHLHMYGGPRRLLNLNLANNGSRFGFVLHVPQRETELVLRSRLRELGGTVEHGVELVGLTDRGEFAEARLRDRAGREVEVTADYVVGCDGAHSRVRHELDLPFDGQAYPQDWVLADVALHGAGTDDAVHLFFRPDGLPLACIPLGGDRWRLVMANAGNRDGRPPSLEEVREMAARRAPWPLEISDPAWLATFRCHLRSASTYRRGRVFIAGDAAHIHSPAAGQGMNTGMLDAQNLAWKIALVATGRAPEGLLDTYEQERAPVASGVLSFTDRIVRLMTMKNPVKRAIRAALIPAASSMPTVQRRTARQLSQTAVRYAAGSFVRAENGPGRRGDRSGPRPGDRVPDLALGGPDQPRPLYAHLRSGQHVLVASGPEAIAELDAMGTCRDGVIRTAVGRIGDSSVALVRPDGVLAALGRDGVAEYLRSLAGAVTPAPVP
jgi:2-polyprenyl-6-methoxyphenol hydroxylase-like FAD-dependent oxidoreductase